MGENRPEFLGLEGQPLSLPLDNQPESDALDTAFENGLVLYPGTGFVDGANGDMVMVGPPFVIEEKEIDEVLQILKATLSKIEEKVS